MDAIYLTLFVSLVLASLGATLFAWTHFQKSRNHDLRLALLPLENDEAVAPVAHLKPDSAKNAKARSAR